MRKLECATTPGQTRLRRQAHGLTGWACRGRRIPRSSVCIRSICPSVAQYVSPSATAPQCGAVADTPSSEAMSARSLETRKLQTEARGAADPTPRCPGNRVVTFVGRQAVRKLDDRSSLRKLRATHWCRAGHALRARARRVMRIQHARQTRTPLPSARLDSVTTMAKLALAMLLAAAMAAPAFATVCDVMEPYLPSWCPCTSDGTYGAVIDCEIDFLYLDEIDFQVSFEPCAMPAHLSIAVSDADFGEIHHHSSANPASAPPPCPALPRPAQRSPALPSAAPSDAL